MRRNSAEPIAKQQSEPAAPATRAGMIKRARLRQIRFSVRMFRVVASSRFGDAALRTLRRWPIGRAILDGALGIHRAFPTLAEAERAISSYANNGRQNPHCAELRLVQSTRPRPSDYAAMFHLVPEIGEAKRIFDVGGNVENLFYCYSEYLKFREDVVWEVYDLPRNVQNKAALGRGSDARNLKFTDRWDQASGCDILIASGSLHHFERPLPQLIDELPKKPRSILINRAPLIDGPSVAVTQDAGQYLTACMLYNRETLILDFMQIGYTLVDMWQAPELSLDVPGRPGHRIHSYSGLWFKLAT
jgi:putative methyltransferase (TIGR04325 family)